MASVDQKKAFIEKYYPSAVKSANVLKAKGLQVNPSFILAQWYHETGVGTNTGAKNNNMAGLYAYATSPYGINGKQYKTMDDFIVDYTATLSNKRYSGINGAGNVTDFAKALKNGGYASDNNYAYSGNWIEAVNLIGSMNISAEQEQTTDKIKWWQFYRKDSNGNKVVVPLKDVALGTTIEWKPNADGKTEVTITDNTLLDSDPNKTTDLMGIEENWFDFAKLGLFQLMIFVLVLFFLYGALLQGSTVDKFAKKFI